MRIAEVMTRELVCCTPETGLQEVAQMMVEHDCGEIPIVKVRLIAGSSVS